MFGATRLLGCDVAPELNAHRVEARRFETARAPEEEEGVVHLGLVGCGSAAVESIAIVSQCERRAELVAAGGVEIRLRFVDRHGLETSDGWTLLHPLLFFLRGRGAFRSHAAAPGRNVSLGGHVDSDQAITLGSMSMHVACAVRGVAVRRS